jgi:drug/metabolite transporter (DMT)-like permease
VTAAALALCAAALWGAGDFFGGLSTRRVSVLIVLFWSQLVGLGGLTLWVVATSPARPGNGLLFALGAGIAGVIGLGCLYRGMAVGAMGIVAPISATAPVVPLVVDLLRGRSPAALQWVGIGLAVAGVILVSREPGGIHDPGSGRRPVAAGVGLALVAALGFGLFIVGLGEAAQESAPWAVATARFGAVSVLLLALTWTRAIPRVSSRQLPLIVVVGVFDAGANALIALAATRGSIGTVAVLSSLYPITTILLARAVLHERLGTTRTVGGLIALGGAALIAAG